MFIIFQAKKTNPGGFFTSNTFWLTYLILIMNFWLWNNYFKLKFNSDYDLILRVEGRHYPCNDQFQTLQTAEKVSAMNQLIATLALKNRW